jgi:cephalosporin-C deacetylase-like acetyl esterase
VWLASRPEVDPARLGVTGISLGGIVAALAAAVDPTLNSAALLLAGGGLADILWDMPEARKFRDLWVAAGRTKADLRALTDPFDPLTYAERLRGKRMLMIAGKVDEVVPPTAARALWEAAGKPTILWYDCGHYSSAGYLLPAMRQTVAFFSIGGPAP